LHDNEVHLIGTVGYQNLKTEGSTKIFGCLSLTSTGGTSWGRSHLKVKSLSKSDITSLSQVGYDESTAVTNILIVVPGLPITNFGSTKLSRILGVSHLHIELELLLPVE
jgi:hypothetical protein